MSANDRRAHHDHEAIVELACVRGLVEVGALLSELEANGIKAISSTDDAGGVRPNLTFANGYRVLVFESDLDQARPVVRALGLD